MSNTIFPDLGPKTVNKLLQDRLSTIVIDNKEVPIRWVDDEAGAKKEILPQIYIEFIDIVPAEDRQFSDILECAFDEIAGGEYASTVQIQYPDAYFAVYDVHVQADSNNDIVDLVTELHRRIPTRGYSFEIDDKYRLTVQRPGNALNADVPEEMFFHRIYTYQIETYIFDYDSMESVPNMKGDGSVNLEFEVKD